MHKEDVEPLPNFLTEEKTLDIAEEFGTPTYVYDEQTMVQQAQNAKSFPAPYGLTVRYAMKANPREEVLRVFDGQGIEIDASSGEEAEKAIKAGIAANRILLTSQILPDNFEGLIAQGVNFNACSLHQLETYGKKFPNSKVSVRINPGLGSGHSTKTNVGGPASSFGIWHEYTQHILDIAREHNLTINRLHTHIGSGSDPEVWRKVAKMSIDAVELFPDVEILNLGGGFKVGRMSFEKTVDLSEIGEPIAKAVEEFGENSGRKLKLEIEPGTYLTASTGAIVAEVADITDTGSSGYIFYKLNTGMTENLRPNLYGSQHPIAVVPRARNEKGYRKAVVVGRNCESGDLLTPHSDDPEKLAPRMMRTAEIGDIAVIGGAGAYCESMAAHRYNSYKRTKALLIDKNGNVSPIKQAV